MSESFFHIGQDSTNYIKIIVLSRTFPNANEYWDGNWCNCYVEFNFCIFKGSFKVSLRSDEFRNFYNQIKTLYDNLSGNAKFKTLENQVLIELEGNIKGEIKISGHLMDEAGIGNKLNFHFTIDQTYLPQILLQIENILKNYPVITK